MHEIEVKESIITSEYLCFIVDVVCPGAQRLLVFDFISGKSRCIFNSF